MEGKHRLFPVSSGINYSLRPPGPHGPKTWGHMWKGVSSTPALSSGVFCLLKNFIVASSIDITDKLSFYSVRSPVISMWRAGQK